jgi:hypothetical protein
MKFLKQKNGGVWLHKIIAVFLVALILEATPAPIFAYAFGYIVGDMRQLASLSGGTACPQTTRSNLNNGAINRQWSTSLGTAPVTILTQDQTPAGQLIEIENVITASLGVWTGIAATSLIPTALAPLARTPAQNACDSMDGLNSICLDQSDPAFTSGVLAFTRVVATDTIGEIVGAHPASGFVGEIVDADILVRPNDATNVFATPAALAANPTAYDLESVLIHELGHSFGLQHSAVWSSIMLPVGPAPGQFARERPTMIAPDAPLGDDDRTAMRVLYPDAADRIHIGTISGQILPVNMLSLAGEPGVTGIFEGQVVAVDAATGSVIAGGRSGWSCNGAGPPVFDGSYTIAALSVGSSQNYQIYVEPFTGGEDSSDVASTVSSLCRNGTPDQGWPAASACSVPTVTTNFMARIRPLD